MIYRARAQVHAVSDRELLRIADGESVHAHAGHEADGPRGVGVDQVAGQAGAGGVPHREEEQPTLRQYRQVGLPLLLRRRIRVVA